MSQRKIGNVWEASMLWQHKARIREIKASVTLLEVVSHAED